MKTKTILLSLSLTLVSVLSFAQNQKVDSKKDDLIRASYASYYIDETNAAYDTPYGEACANIILKAYRGLLQIPETSSLPIDASDKIKIDQLVTKLNQLRTNPPSWEEIFKLEKERLIQWDKAISHKSKYK